MPKEVSAGAVIFRRDNNIVYYLLLHYKLARPEQGRGGHWDFPKGHIEEGEKEEDTVRREIKEETGIEDIEIISGFKEWIKYFFRRTYDLDKSEKSKAPLVFKIVIFYLVETMVKEVKISSEHLDYKWLPYEQAFERLTFNKAKEILKKANKFLKKYAAQS